MEEKLTSAGDTKLQLIERQINPSPRQMENSARIPLFSVRLSHRAAENENKLVYIDIAK